MPTGPSEAAAATKDWPAPDAKALEEENALNEEAGLTWTVSMGRVSAEKDLNILGLRERGGDAESGNVTRLFENLVMPAITLLRSGA